MKDNPKSLSQAGDVVNYGSDPYEKAQDKKIYRQTRIFQLAAGVVAIILLSLLVKAVFGLRQEQKQQKSAAQVAVTVAPVTQKSVPLEIRTIGSVTPYSTIQVKSRIAGQIVHVYFKEGDYVKKGDMLFTIDPRSYQAALKQAQANLAKDMAQVKQAEANTGKDRALLHKEEANLNRDNTQQANAEKEAGRYAGLVSQGAVSQEQYDQMKTNADSMSATLQADLAAIENVRAFTAADMAAIDNAKASVRADQAGIENAQVELSYTAIRSPIDGRTGSLLIYDGNVVKENDLPLLVINQVKPIYVTFAAPESALIDIRKYEKDGNLKVSAVIGSDDEHPISGQLSFSDNSVDTATGTIKLKATFANDDGRLWPGQFVNVVFRLAEEPNAILIPSRALQAGQQGQYVFVLKADKTVESRQVEVVRSFSGQSVIKKGLHAGEIVITDGQLQLVPGTRVKIKDAVPDTR